MTSLKSDCRKFSPNIFNKTKCQNCFRGKESHTHEALESNRVTRKVCKCGYLFVAPNWDFSVSINRTKRWQRRWFVLYDDGELTYSVDEHPDTVPQAVIDMNNVLEVADAEDVTGNQFSLAITASDKVHFVKGACREEIKWWYEVLLQFPHNTVCGKYKRNATFPGRNSVSSRQKFSDDDSFLHKGILTSPNNLISSTCTVDDFSNRKLQSPSSDQCRKVNEPSSTELPSFTMQSKLPKSLGTSIHAEKNSYRIICDENDSNLDKEVLAQNSSSKNKDKLLSCKFEIDRNGNDVIKDTKGQMNQHFSLNRLKTQVVDYDRGNIRRYIKKEYQGKKNHHSLSDGVAKMVHSCVSKEQELLNDCKDKQDDHNDSYPIPSQRNYHHNPVYMLLSDSPTMKKINSPDCISKNDEPPPSHLKQSSKKPESSVDSWPVVLSVISTTLADGIDAERNRCTLLHSKNKNAKALSEPSGKYSLKAEGQLIDSILQVRGDPDGCGLDALLSTCASSQELLADHESLSFKRGWLMKQGINKEWNKYWFVLRNSALTYYSDPISEDAGILDGMIDMRLVKNVTESSCDHRNAFSVVMKNGNSHLLSAGTSKLRISWIHSILKAANLLVPSMTKDQVNKCQEPQVTSHVSKEESKDVNLHDHALSSTDFEAKSDFLSHSKYFTVLDSEENYSSTSSHAVPYTLPLSPPLTRTAISRVKERARSRSTSRSQLSRIRSHGSIGEDNTQAYSDEVVSDNFCSNLKSTHGEEKSTQEVSATTLKNNKQIKMDSVNNVTNTSALHEYKNQLNELKDKLEDCSWYIWVEVSRFCKEIEKKLLENEKLSTKDTQMKENLELTLKQKKLQDQMKEISDLLSSLCKIEEKLHNVQIELGKTSEIYFMKNNETYFKTMKVNECETSCNNESINILNEASSKKYLLTLQLCRVKEENRILKKDLKEAQSNYDEIELHCINMRQDKKQTDQLHQSNMSLMTSRVDYLTNKLFLSEKNLRHMRQKVAKLEQKQERRRSSLKGKEGLTLSKEYEIKLTELEQKISTVEAALQTTNESEALTKAKGNLLNDNYKFEETHGLLLRLNNLDRRVKEVLGTTEEVKCHINSESTHMPNVCTPCPEPKPDIHVSQSTAESFSSISTNDSLNSNIISPENEISNKNDLLVMLKECFKSLSIKIISLTSWLKSALNLLYNEVTVSDVSHLSPNESLSQHKLFKELKFLVQTIDDLATAAHSNLSFEKNKDVFIKIFYNLLLLQEITKTVFKMSNYENYNNSILNHHLLKVEEIVAHLENHVQIVINKNTSLHQKDLVDALISSHFYSTSLSTSLCSIHSDPCELKNTQNLISKYDLVKKKQHEVSITIHNFKEKIIVTLFTLLANFADKNVQSCLNDCKQKNLYNQYSTSKLVQIDISSQISHVITLLTQSFNSNLSEISNHITFLSRDIMEYEKWKNHVCNTLQQEMEQLSLDMESRLQSLDIRYLTENQDLIINYYVISSIAEIAQVTALYSVVKGAMSFLQQSITTFCSDCVDETGLFKNDNTSLDCYVNSLLQIFCDKVNQQAEVSGHIMNNIANSHNFLISNGIAMFAQEAILNIIGLQKLYHNAVEERNINEGEIKYLKEKVHIMEKERHYDENCDKCTDLKQKVISLQEEIKELNSTTKAESPCEQCSELRLELQQLAGKQEKVNSLEKNEHESSLKNMLISIVREKEELLDEERKKLEKECHSIQMRVRNVEMKYEEEIKCLQAVYNQHLSQNLSAINEETVRCRYKSEIEQLKCLCEKGMLAMEASYQRILKDMQQNHQQEIAQLLAEKEKLLAEEAHATSVALHAINKAHREELQQQVVKLKAELQKEVNAQHVIEAVRNEYESALDDIKQEILTLTDKYSLRCLESALLAEKLEVVSQQLQKTNLQVVELLAKNSRLQAHIASDPDQKQEELNGCHYQKLEHFQPPPKN